VGLSSGSYGVSFITALKPLMAVLVRVWVLDHKNINKWYKNKEDCYSRVPRLTDTRDTQLKGPKGNGDMQEAKWDCNAADRFKRYERVNR